MKGIGGECRVLSELMVLENHEFEHQGTTGSSSGVIIAKMAKSAFPGDRPG